MCWTPDTNTEKPGLPRFRPQNDLLPKKIFVPRRESVNPPFSSSPRRPVRAPSRPAPAAAPSASQSYRSRARAPRLASLASAPPKAKAS
jgi:hypothetical protein